MTSLSEVWAVLGPVGVALIGLALLAIGGAWKHSQLSVPKWVGMALALFFFGAGLLLAQVWDDIITPLVAWLVLLLVPVILLLIKSYKLISWMKGG